MGKGFTSQETLSGLQKTEQLCGLETTEGDVSAYHCRSPLADISSCGRLGPGVLLAGPPVAHTRALPSPVMGETIAEGLRPIPAPQRTHVAQTRRLSVKVVDWATNQAGQRTRPVRFGHTNSSPSCGGVMYDELKPTFTEKGKPFDRDMSYLPDRILAGATSADPLDDRFPSGSKDSPRDVEVWPALPGRYRLIAARACPWANRSIIVRELLGLQDVISLGTPGPTHDSDSWRFDLDPSQKDPVLGIEKLQDAYFARQPGYPRGITVPAIVEIDGGKVVTNDFPQITHDLFFEWREHHKPGAPDLWPAEQREEMEQVMHRVFTEVNNGVYRCGFAGSQEAYDDAYDRLWATMDWLEERLETRRYLMGAAITEADVRLFTTLVRFDAVYHGHFKCNRHKLTELPNLWGYVRDLFQTPGFGETVDFEQIKQHYYVVHTDVNPTGIVPLGPDLSGWTSAHGRAAGSLS